MSISYKEIPLTKVPGMYAEFDNSAAGAGGVMPFKVLIVGQQTKSAAKEVSLCLRAEDADAKFGYGSQIALMVRAFLKNAPNVELYTLPVDDAGTGTAATRTITVSGTASASGTISLYVGGQLVQVSVTSGDTANSIAAAIAAAVGSTAAASSTTQLPVTASASTSTVTLTAKNKGSVAETIDVSVNYNRGDVTPAGVTLTIGSWTSGSAADPLLSNVTGGSPAVGLAALIANYWFNEIVIPFADNTNVGYLKDELDARWTATRQQTGVMFFGKSFNGESDPVQAAKTYYDGKNSQLMIPASYIFSPTSPFEIAAALAGVCAVSTIADPAMPIKDYELKGVLAPAEGKEISFVEKGILLDAGCSDIDCNIDTRVVYVRRVVTTYTQNDAGAADNSYSQLETIFCLSYYRWYWNNKLATEYTRTKIAKDGSKFGVGQKILTPKGGKALAIDFYEDLVEAGICQDSQWFADNIVVEIDAQDPHRMNFLLPPDFVKQLFVCASKIQFK